MKRLTKVLASVLLTFSIVLAMPMEALAHVGNYNIKAVDGSNLILVTYNSHDPVSGLALDHNIRLYDLAGQPISFDKVEMEVLRSGKSVHKSAIPMSSNNDASLNYTYPTEGQYTLRATFTDNDKQISQGEMVLEVGKGAGQNFFATAFTLQTLLAFLLGASALKIIFIRKQIIASMRGVLAKKSKIRKKNSK